MEITKDYLEKSLNFNSEMTKRTLLMYDIAKNISNEPKNGLALKGGTALLFCYGLNRYSTDLDYDGYNYDFNIDKNIKEAFKTNSLNIDNINIKKDTNTVKRFMIHYKEAENHPIKLEISFRNIDYINNIKEHFTKTNNINTYNINFLANNKLSTFLTRMTARDIYDAAFLFDKYSDNIGKDYIIKCKDKINSVGLDQLERIVKSEEIFKNYDVDKILINFENNVNNLSKQHNLQTQSQSSGRKR